MPSQPTPELLFETLNAYQRTACLETAIELDVFTTIGADGATAKETAARCEASPRGIRILCDQLSMLGFLVKRGDRYRLTPVSAAFLDRNSPACMSGIVEFLRSSAITGAFERLTEAVRRGGTALSAEGSTEANHPMWVTFARAMQPMMAVPAQALAELIPLEGDRPTRILDIAAGHGLFGIAFARRYPRAEVVAVDWPAVLEVAAESAAAAGVAERHVGRPGDAFEVAFGENYDLALLTNFLHHFDAATCTRLLRKVHQSLGPGGRAAALEFVPNPDRISPPTAAVFSLMMLASTPSGDAYTFEELAAMFRDAGFTRSELHPLSPSFQQVVIAHA